MFGGNGFIGSQICREAVQNGWEVISVSRSGAKNLPFSEFEEPWVKRVRWIEGDALNPESYKEHLSNATAVVHSVGILFEKNPLKMDFIRKAFMTEEAQAENHPTFEQINRDSAVISATEAKAYPNIKKFVYISANSKSMPLFGIDRRYLTTKQEAERILIEMGKPTAVIIRPGLVYGGARKSSFAAAGFCGISSWIGRHFNPFNLLMEAPPVSVQTVAKAVVQSLNSSSDATQVLEGRDIEIEAKSAN